MRILGVNIWKKAALDRDEWAKLLKKARVHQGLSSQWWWWWNGFIVRIWHRKVSHKTSHLGGIVFCHTALLNVYGQCSVYKLQSASSWQCIRQMNMGPWANQSHTDGGNVTQCDQQQLSDKIMTMYNEIHLNNIFLSPVTQQLLASSW